MRKATLILLFLSFGAGLPAQTPHFRKHPLGELYRNTLVTSIYEDRNTLLWFGTDEGLFFYDGLEFAPYLKADSSSNKVTALYHDSTGVLWVGYEDGSIYHLKNQKMQRWEPEEGIPVVPVTGFAEDSYGRIWIATYGEGVYVRSEGRLYNFDIEDGLLGEDIYVMTPDTEGQIWLGTDGGVNICAFEEKQKRIRALTRRDGLPDDIVREILPDSSGNMWMGFYDGGFCRYDPRNRQFLHPLPEWDEGVVNCLAVFEGREVWVGTEGKGLFRYDLRSHRLQPVPMPEAQQGLKVYDLHKDTEGNLWVVSNKLGVCSANRQFEFLETGLKDIQSVRCATDEKLWVGTQQGLFSLDLDEAGQAHLQPWLEELQLNVISLFEDRFGNIWVGTFGQGLYVLDPRTRTWKHYDEPHGLTNNSILSIDGVGDKIWLATLGGVTEIHCPTNPFLLQRLRMTNYNQNSGLGTNYIYQVFIDSRGRTWFATDGKGLSLLEGGRIHNFGTAYLPLDDNRHDTIPLHAVYSLTEDLDGNIWLATDRAGIFRFDGQAFTHLEIRSGRREIRATGLVTDSKGNILLVCEEGIDLLDPRTGHIIYFGEEVGIPNDLHPNLNALTKDPHGNIWIAGNAHFIRYTPLQEHLEIHPRTLVTGVSVFLEPIDFLSDRIFSYKENNLIFEYVGLWYTHPGSVKYRHKLEGFDHDWIVTKDRQVTYSNLPPGEYTFLVTASENEGFSDEPVASYSFEVRPPLWMQPWFIALALSVLGGLFYAYLKQRDRRLQRWAQLEKEKIASQFEALKSQINPHFLFNSFNTLVTIIEENPKLAVEYVEILADFYRTILQFRDREIISLEEEIEMVKNYHFLLQKRFGESFRLNIRVNGEPVYVAPLTLQLLVENAVKHNVISKDRPLIVDITLKNGELVVRNNLQKKTQPARSTHFGLQSLNTRYLILTNRGLNIRETDSYFEVGVPVIRS